MNITLTKDELDFAAIVGARRRAGAISSGLADRYGSLSGDLWGSDIEASAAEMVVAKALDRYWLPALFVQRGEGDVGRYQVRSTPRLDGSLILHRQDNPEEYFVLVVGKAPTYTVSGWIKASDGQRDEWWREDTGRPAFFVPQSALRPIKGEGG